MRTVVAAYLILSRTRRRMVMSGEREEVLGNEKVEKICTSQLQTPRPDVNNDKDEDSRKNP